MSEFIQSFYLFFKKSRAFIRKDFLGNISYKLDFVTQWAGVFVAIFTFYYLSKIIGKQASGYLAEYGGDYFPFVLVGIAVRNYIGTSLTIFSSKIAKEQIWGTLEVMLTTPTKLFTILVSLSLYDFILDSVNVFLYVFIGVVFLGINFSSAHLFAVAVILILTIISFSCFGIISASFTMVFKRGDPVLWLMSGLATFFGGVLFPVSVLPKYLQVISYSIPITYSLRALRFALLKGYSWDMLSGDIIVLLGFCLVLLPISMIVFRWALIRAKARGTLAFY
ncbi:MAG: ABC transporter permease [Candidatus Omnitrophica bacterium]|nr:ABC transporter permease [Candidatus Omnitrophota bacterium]HOX54896.1 ABC transporter permease [Candidatus Omnitrophota bacterium]